MPVYKHRSVADMLPFQACSPGDADDLRSAWELSLLCYRLRPWRFPPGVHKHRSVEELDGARAAWDLAAGGAR